ncbi:MAG: alpha-L-fucosidase [Opitutales bacterium]|nr:alpha-L-fucosidase [Opitutales bacterium]
MGESGDWYATWWAQRIIDVIDRYDPDFIYTDGTGDQPFSGADTGTGFKCDALQRVLAHYYNRSLQTRAKVDVFSVIKFRPKTNGTVTTKEFGIPEDIVSDEPWIAEVPVGDWYYRPGIVNDSGMVIRYLVEAAARDGNAAVCVSPQPDGSLDLGSRQMLGEVGQWLAVNGSGIYGSRSWKCPGEGEVVDGKLKMLPGGKLDREHADFPFDENDFRFTQGSDGAIYAFCMVVPEPGAKLRIRSMGSSSRLFEAGVKSVELMDEPGLKLDWRQDEDALTIICPDQFRSKTAVAFRVY